MKFLIVTSVRLFLLLHLSLHLEAYTLVDNFTISCGATGKSFDNERTWTGDTDSMLFSPHFGTVAAKATTQASSTNQVPYTTARLSRSQFSYSFPVTRGPKFLRLFFYPSSYLSFPRTEATFTVQSNQFILLDGFNASLYAEVENKETIFREYVIYVDDGQRLILTFTPSSQSNSYAFINGIEVLSMPDDLYHTSEDDMGFKLLGHDMLFSVQSSAVLQTEYRIKVGGQGISPGKDTGLFKKWISASWQENHVGAKVQTTQSSTNFALFLVKCQVNALSLLHFNLFLVTELFYWGSKKTKKRVVLLG